jgi:hypothetical protein
MLLHVHAINSVFLVNTESTETEFSRYQFLKGTDRFSEELNFFENRGTKLNRIEVSNAQGKSHACMTKK